MRSMTPPMRGLRAIHRRRAGKLDPPARGARKWHALLPRRVSDVVAGDRCRPDYRRSTRFVSSALHFAPLSGTVLRDNAPRRVGLGYFSATFCSPPCGPSTRPSIGECSAPACLRAPSLSPLSKPICPWHCYPRACERLLRAPPFSAPPPRTPHSVCTCPAAFLHRQSSGPSKL